MHHSLDPCSDRVFVGTACATPRVPVAALEAMSPAPPDVELLQVLTDHALPHDAQGPRHHALSLGSALQRQLAEIAQARGVRGFVAETLSSNPRRIQLATGGPGEVLRDDDGGTVRVTTLF